MLQASSLLKSPASLHRWFLLYRLFLASTGPNCRGSKTSSWRKIISIKRLTTSVADLRRSWSLTKGSHLYTQANLDIVWLTSLSWSACHIVSQKTHIRRVTQSAQEAKSNAGPSALPTIVLHACSADPNTSGRESLSVGRLLLRPYYLLKPVICLLRLTWKWMVMMLIWTAQSVLYICEFAIQASLSEPPTRCHLEKRTPEKYSNTRSRWSLSLQHCFL